MDTPTPAAAQGRALWALLLATLGSAAAGQPLGGDPVCTARPLAKYSLTFTGKWSQTAFPKQYPLFRPPAQWSSLLGKCSPTPTPARGSPRGGSPRQLHHISVWRALSSSSVQCKKCSLSADCMPAGDNLGSGDGVGQDGQRGEGQRDLEPTCEVPGHREAAGHPRNGGKGAVLRARLTQGTCRGSAQL